ncbi:zinc finger protein ZAT9-like [Arachis stenosperma]|uniref:zinc finger protein ZAT9-like n=1 Tax=Arachis stenosperma TaxID=217475 RepID=UPI0025ABB35F|nr:zinc finger protein ZAT9-like [Arachis stenosperma]
MEKHKCKLCFRNFSNGRALGGHMRSHMMNLHVPPKPNESPPPSPPAIQLSFEAESSTPLSPSASSSSYFGKEDDTSLYYGLRENPKRSFRIADPEFSFVAAGDTGSLILQEDRESETESSKNVTKKRSKRAWKLGGGGDDFNSKKVKLSQLGNGNNKNESASSASDATTEEDIALWLMMLSRDTGNNWKINHKININIEEQELEEEDYDEEDEDEEEEEEDEGEESDEYEVVKNKAKSNKVRGGRYKCETCNKVFRSYQALGGHRASHKKMKMDYNNHNDSEFMVVEDHADENVNNNNNEVFASSALASVENGNNNNGGNNNNKKIHECPVCFRVFASGQALGGHKRTHVTTVSTPTITTRAIAEVKAEAEAIAASKAAVATASSSKLGRESFIDLNLPAPAEEDDASQFEDSAVSDAEFVNPVKVFPR